MALRLWSLLRLVSLHFVVTSSLVNLACAADNDTNPISTPSGVYNSSDTPASFPWNTYNYCNAPHVNSEHYVKPDNVTGSKLVYANAMMRHHKRTPDNLYPMENEVNQQTWNCTDFRYMLYGGGTTNIRGETFSPTWHPFISQFWNGTCEMGTLTAGGLDDAIQHGKDFWSVYSHETGLLQQVSEDEIHVRTSPSDRTQQVAGGMLTGMDPATATKTFPVHIMPSNIDSITPDYSCPKADSIRDAYQSVPAWTDHLEANADLANKLGTMFGTLDLSAWNSWYDHYFDTFSSRTCGGHLLPCNSTGACATPDDAARVFSIGDWEYNYIWNTAENSSTYNQLYFGVAFMELAHNFKLFRSGEETYKLRLYVAHDGSMIRLAALLGLGEVAPLRWPALGSEIVMEVWETPDKKYFVRIMHEGTPVQTKQWIALDDFISALEAQIPADIFDTCMSS